MIVHRLQGQFERTVPVPEMGKPDRKDYTIKVGHG